MSDITALIDAHLSSYGDPDATRRSAIVERIWDAQGQLIDPPLAATGHAQISLQADQLLTQFPGHRFVRSSGVDSHHDMARYSWQLVDPAAKVVLEGIDIAQVGPEGRLVRVTGFFGPLPALSPAAWAVAIGATCTGAGSFAPCKAPAASQKICTSIATGVESSGSGSSSVEEDTPCRRSS